MADSMAERTALADLLRATLEQVQVPANYETLREKLKSIKPTRAPPVIKQSPEDHFRIWGSDAE